MTKNEFKRATGLTDAFVDKWYEPVKTAMQEFAIATPLRQAHFLAQVGHESGGFRTLEENFNYSSDRLLAVFPKYFNAATAKQYTRNKQAIANRVYASRMGNGPESSGDGWNYRGSGLIQITGKDNHSAVARAFGMEVDESAERLRTDPAYAAEAAAWWWQANGLNELADQDSLARVTRRVNGGTNGINDRGTRLERAKGALNVR